MKYHNEKVTIRGQRFDSRKEARRYEELMLLARAGQISGLQRQVKYVLIPAQYEGEGRKRRCLERECAYLADFVYTENGQTVVEAVKGYKGGGAYAVFKIKEKLMLYVHKIKIREV